MGRAPICFLWTVHPSPAREAPLLGTSFQAALLDYPSKDGPSAVAPAARASLAVTAVAGYRVVVISRGKGIGWGKVAIARLAWHVWWPEA